MPPKKPVAACTDALINLAHTIHSQFFSDNPWSSTKHYITEIAITQDHVDIGHMGLKEMSAHAQIQWTAKIEAQKTDLHACARRAGLLDVGLGVLHVALYRDARDKLHLAIRHSKRPLRERDFVATAPKPITTCLQRTIDLLSHHPFMGTGLQEFLVNDISIYAPTPKAAAMLYLLGQNPDRLHRLVTKGPQPGARLKIAQVVAVDGELLFDTP